MKNSMHDRITITRTGKILRRAIGQSHFKTRKSKKILRKKAKRRVLQESKKDIFNY